MALDGDETALAAAMRDWRRALHAMPEPGYAEARTAAFIAQRLRAIGVDAVTEGVGGTGVVAVVHGQPADDGAAVLCRADMDALPIHEATGVPHASRTPGWMHACGHDGHVAMLLGGAQALTASRRFRGDAVLVFQPAEEFGAGAHAMIADGLLDRWPAQAAFGLHTMPGLPLGAFATRSGPVMALSDDFQITVTGRGGHAALPFLARDPIAPAMALAQAVNGLTARAAPGSSAVVGVTCFNAGEASNVIPETAILKGTIRTLSRDEHRALSADLTRLCAHFAAAFEVDVAYAPSETIYPPTVNAASATDLAIAALRAEGWGAEGRAPKIVSDLPPVMASEDFSFIANALPSCFLFIGNGASAPLHHPAYDFDDAAAIWGARFWRRIVETALPL